MYESPHPWRRTENAPNQNDMVPSENDNGGSMDCQPPVDQAKQAEDEIRRALSINHRELTVKAAHQCHAGRVPDSTTTCGEAFTCVDPACCMTQQELAGYFPSDSMKVLSPNSLDSTLLPLPPDGADGQQAMPGGEDTSPLQCMQSITNSLLAAADQGFGAQQFAQKRPSKVVLPPITQQQFDHYSNLNAEDIVKRHAGYFPSDSMKVLSPYSADSPLIPLPPEGAGGQQAMPGGEDTSPRQRMQSITNSLLAAEDQGFAAQQFAQQRPSKAVLPPITQEQFDHYSNLNTEDIVKRVKEQLSQYSISQLLFGESVLGQSQHSVSQLLARPKPWHMLTQKGRKPFIRMKMFLEDENAVHNLVASQYKIVPERLMWMGGYGGVPVNTAGSNLFSPVGPASEPPYPGQRVGGGGPLPNLPRSCSPPSSPSAPLSPSPGSRGTRGPFVQPCVCKMAAGTTDLDPQIITARIKETLTVHNIRQKLFGEAVLGLSNGRVSVLLSKPKPWHMLSIKGREPFIRMQLWLNDPANVEKLQAIMTERREGSNRFSPVGPASEPPYLGQRVVGGGPQPNLPRPCSPPSSPSAPLSPSLGSRGARGPFVQPCVCEIAAVATDLDTQIITARIKETLTVHDIREKLFGEVVLGLSRTRSSVLLSKPKPWHMLSIKGREPFIRMQLWLNDPANVETLQAIKTERMEGPMPTDSANLDEMNESKVCMAAV